MPPVASAVGSVTYGCVSYAVVMSSIIPGTPSSRPDPPGESVDDGVVRAGGESGAGLIAAVKPLLRGWLHLGMFPVVVLAGVVLILVSDPGAVRTSCAVFTASAALLFGVSAVYHRGTWGPKAATLLKRFDHSNIYLIIAGTYTPFAVTLLPAAQARTLLIVIWGGAIGGVLFRVFWVGAPRWLYTALYLALGWAAIFYVVPFWRTGGPVIGSLIAAGGLFYTAGGIIYGVKRPNPWPRWFGFHEVFHALTLGGFVAHFVAVILAVLGYRTAV